MNTQHYRLGGIGVSGRRGTWVKGAGLVALLALVGYVRLQGMDAPLYTSDYYPDPGRLAQVQQVQREGTLDEQQLVWQTYRGTAQDGQGNPFQLSYQFLSEQRVLMTVIDASRRHQPRLELLTPYRAEGAVMVYPGGVEAPLARLIPEGGQPVRQVSGDRLEVFLFGEWQVLTREARRS